MTTGRINQVAIVPETRKTNSSLLRLISRSALRNQKLVTHCAPRRSKPEFNQLAMWKTTLCIKSKDFIAKRTNTTISQSSESNLTKFTHILHETTTSVHRLGAKPRTVYTIAARFFLPRRYCEATTKSRTTKILLYRFAQRNSKPTNSTGNCSLLMRVAY
jgi:hypothetical protein